MIKTHYVKLVATMSEALTKETILSKLNNFVAAFRFDMTWKSFDDHQKKYLDTIIKLDNSKTIILETKWDEVKIKNINEIKLKKGFKYGIEFSNIQEESRDVIFVNYQHLHEIPVDTEITFEDSKTILRVLKNDEWVIECVVDKIWRAEPWKKIKFLNYKPKLSFLSEKDKKDIVWWIKIWVNMLFVSSVKAAEDIESIRNFLDANEWEGIKIIVRLHTKLAYENIDEIIDSSDGLLLTHWKLKKFAPDSSEDSFDILEKIKNIWKPFFCNIDKNFRDLWKKEVKNIISQYIELWIDSFVADENIVTWEDLQDTLIEIATIINETNIEEIDLDRRVPFAKLAQQEENVQHYLIDRWFKITKEMPIKAIICYTDTWELITKLWSLRPTIPLIVFTKNDYVYRYVNLLRGVRWYKISKNFSYESFKSLWKEMIRILFKWNISLDDKILIIQVKEDNIDDEKVSNWINWIELYRFKNI